MPEETPDPGTYRERRPATLLAALGLIAVTSGAVGGIVYDLAINGNSVSLTHLGTLATLGMGGLLALAGGRNNGESK